jgi:threonine dehydrogenase-like Zn-dependent dehydrogenase
MRRPRRKRGLRHAAIRPPSLRARLVHADQNCYHVPESVGDEQALFLSDAAPTGFMGADFAQPKGGDSIAVWGCGGVGPWPTGARS